jgi:hypothetical protein
LAAGLVRVRVVRNGGGRVCREHPHHYLFLGPYAEWLVPERKHRPGFRETPLAETLLGGWVLYLQHFLGDIPQVKRGRTLYYRYTFMPQQERPNQPKRRMCFSPDDYWPEAEDLTEIDRQAEMNWFAKEFGEELRTLATHFGGPPAIRWGLVGWSS